MFIIKTHKIFDYDLKNNEKKLRVVWNFNNDGNYISGFTYFPNGNIQSEFRPVDGNINLYIQIEYDEEGKVLSKINRCREYTEAGKLKRESYYDPEFETEYLEIMRHDEADREVNGELYENNLLVLKSESVYNGDSLFTTLYFYENDLTSIQRVITFKQNGNELSNTYSDGWDLLCSELLYKSDTGYTKATNDFREYSGPQFSLVTMNENKNILKRKVKFISGIQDKEEYQYLDADYRACIVKKTKTGKEGNILEILYEYHEYEYYNC